MCLPAVLLLLITAVGCTDDDEDDENRPATFGDACHVADLCRAPFTCLDQPPNGKRCTRSCASNADCPSWEATGHCAGPVRGVCGGDKLCVPYVCK